jgi:hypothetical protein
LEHHEILLRRLLSRIGEAERKEAPSLGRAGKVSIPGSQEVGEESYRNVRVRIPLVASGRAQVRAAMPHREAADGIRTHNIYLGKVALYH